MEHSLYDKATSILGQKGFAKITVERINVVLQINPEKEGKEAEHELIENAYFTLQDHYRDKLVKYARLLLEKNKEELQELIKCLDVEFENL